MVLLMFMKSAVIAGHVFMGINLNDDRGRAYCWFDDFFNNISAAMVKS